MHLLFLVTSNFLQLLLICVYILLHLNYLFLVYFDVCFLRSHFFAQGDNFLIFLFTERCLLLHTNKIALQGKKLLFYKRQLLQAIHALVRESLQFF